MVGPFSISEMYFNRMGHNLNPPLGGGSKTDLNRKVNHCIEMSFLDLHQIKTVIFTAKAFN
ncbi:hypothetical protein B4907_13620 [Yersinia kristensenii]|nr:hypothetical protein B4907_13620 [Yersinia kristensenii]